MKVQGVILRAMAKRITWWRQPGIASDRLAWNLLAGVSNPTSFVDADWISGSALLCVAFFGEKSEVGIRAKRLTRDQANATSSTSAVRPRRQQDGECTAMTLRYCISVAAVILAGIVLARTFAQASPQASAKIKEAAAKP